MPLIMLVLAALWQGRLGARGVFIAGCCCSLTLPYKTLGPLDLVMADGGRGSPGTVKRGRAPGLGSLVLRSQSRAGSARPCATDRGAASRILHSRGVRPSGRGPRAAPGCSRQSRAGRNGQGMVPARCWRGLLGSPWGFPSLLPSPRQPGMPRPCATLRGAKPAKTSGVNQNILIPSSRCCIPPGDTSPVPPGCPRGKARL